jgi:heat shock protein HtpX
VTTHNEVRNLLDGLAIAAGIPTPRFAMISDPSPNSFGVGTRRRQRAIIAITDGLVDHLSRDELEAVLAYEVTRIRSYDVALASWTVASRRRDRQWRRRDQLGAVPHRTGSAGVGVA